MPKADEVTQKGVQSRSYSFLALAQAKLVEKWPE